MSDAVVQPVYTEDLTQHITTIGQRVMSPTRLQAMVEKLGFGQRKGHLDEVVNDIQLNMKIEPVPDISQFGPAAKRRPGRAVRFLAST